MGSGFRGYGFRGFGGLAVMGLTGASEADRGCRAWAHQGRGVFRSKGSAGMTPPSAPVSACSSTRCIANNSVAATVAKVW